MCQKDGIFRLYIVAFCEMVAVWCPKIARAECTQNAKWIPTNRTLKHKGVVRKLWRSAKDASVTAVKRIVKAADGSKKVRYERV